MVAIRVVDTFCKEVSIEMVMLGYGFDHLPVPYTLEHAAQLGVFPSHFDLRFRHAMHAVLAAESLELLDFFFVGGADPAETSEGGTAPLSWVTGCSTSMAVTAGKSDP
jgi:hypothetical protein